VGYKIDKAILSTSTELLEWSKSNISLVAGSSCGRCAQHFRRIRGCDARIRRESGAYVSQSASFPSSRTCASHWIGLAPLKWRSRPSAIESQDLSVRRVVLSGCHAYDVRYVGRVSCKCCAHLPSVARDVTFRPLYRSVYPAK
jgi:hypothetical protein